MRRSCTLFILLLFSALLQAQSPQFPLAAQQLVDDAMQKQKAGDLAGAIAGYKQFLKIHPEATPIHTNLGVALAGLGRYEEAVSEYKIALKQSPAFPAARLNLALAYYKMGYISEASTQLVRVHREEPNNLQVVQLLGDCFLRMGENKKTIDLLQPIAKDHPEDLATAYMLGTALLRNKQPDEGAVVLNRILKDSDSPETHLLLGMSKYEAMQYPEAIADLSKAAAIDPSLPDVYSYLGQAQMASGDMNAARDAFEKELKSNPNDFESNVRLAVLLKQDGNYDRARELLNRALLVRPKDPGALYQVGATYLAAGDMNRALTSLEALVKEYPDFLEPHVSLAQVYYRLRRKEDGDREREIVQKLKAEQDAAQSKVKGQAQQRP
ncbi:MAG TPA: tetratricopeptide repeat protein [Candidatus Sulfotelmatobacter sp.]|nr:tetratricopeptide repeat protein [Candidatus Sulfotelmatobacter sp.]